MASDKTQHARCIIENYKNELTDSKKRHFSVYNRHFTDDIRKCYCFPNLYSALFYDPTPEHIDYIGREAYDILLRNGYLLADDIMKRAAKESAPEDAGKCIEGICSSSNRRELLIFGSCHPDGYFREKCLEKFAGMELYGFIRYTLIRLNDWVREVRLTAYETFKVLARREHAAKEIIAAMDIVEHLRQSSRAERDNVFSMEGFDRLLMEMFSKSEYNVLSADHEKRRACYKIYELHPENKYCGLMLDLFRKEPSGELRSMLERIIIQLYGGEVPADVLGLFMQDSSEKVRLTAYRYRLEHTGIWEGFEKLLLSSSWRIRRFAADVLKKSGFDIVSYCRNELPKSLYAIGKYGTKDDIPLIRPYLKDHPREALYALTKLGAADSREIVLDAMHDPDRKLAKAAFHIAWSIGCFTDTELMYLIKNETDVITQWRFMLLLTRNGVWNVMPLLIRFVRDHPKQRESLLYLIKKNTGSPVYITWEHNQKIQKALGYAREENCIPCDINNQIFSDMKNLK